MKAYHLKVMANVNTLPNDNFLGWSKLKAFAVDKIIVNLKTEILSGIGGKHCGKRRKCWSPAHNVFKRLSPMGR